VGIKTGVGLGLTALAIGTRRDAAETTTAVRKRDRFEAIVGTLERLDFLQIFCKRQMAFRKNAKLSLVSHHGRFPERQKYAAKISKKSVD